MSVEIKQLKVILMATLKEAPDGHNPDFLLY
jgi:hypothetical protein